QNHLRDRRVLSHLFEFSISRGVPPRLRSLSRRKPNNNDAVRLPAAFEHLDMTATYKVFAAGRTYSFGDALTIFGVFLVVTDCGDVYDYISCHRLYSPQEGFPEWLTESTIWLHLSTIRGSKRRFILGRLGVYKKDGRTAIFHY